ncbi:putative bifunctional diguanylate cyclase/phosphodiesterase [Methylocystis iwaonis]|uniref:GGDEF-domain containing protein n=1 Tax=Methylocystis iwaonis TaxID=2885079 RepID=A0ABM8EA03_9HYPH|nr:EAL domain-containing protein [Methylocystis iwaonis]BDV34741.1 GGDEF-domain containing protein [Methylocystis iwaonis]
MQAKASTNPRSAAEAEIYADLVETLFDTTHSLVTGILSGVLVPAIAWISTRETSYLWLAGLMSLIGVYRVHVLLSHDRAPIEARRRDAEIWERRYAVGAISFMVTLGVATAILFNYHQNEIAAYYGVIIMTGVTGNLAARNAARPNIVFWQMMGTCMPLAFTIIFNFSPWYWGISAFLGFGALAVFKTTKFLKNILVSALRNGRDAMRQRQKFSIALNSMTHGLCMGDSSLTISVMNRRIVEFFGIVAAATPIKLDALAHAIGRTANMSPAEIEEFKELWMRHAAMPQATVFMRRIGERYFNFHCERAEGGAFVTVIEDVSTQQRALREIERIAHFDELTGLPNRYHFQDALGADMLRLGVTEGNAVLITVDLDRFKEVNDTLGHMVGDKLLAHVGARLSACAPTPNLVARLGGDEFCILMRAPHEASQIDAMSAVILKELSRPFRIDGHRITVGATIGLAIAPQDADTPIGLLKCADLALYEAKLGARGTAVRYSPKMQDALLEKRAIEEELREALVKDELALFYQPIVDSRRGAIVAMEALVRWRHPERGIISPGVFIPVAEQTGLIVEIGAWVLRRACEDAVAWPRHVRVAVNLAPKQFHQADLIDTIATALDDSGLDPDRLELEITESTLISNTDDIQAKLAKIDALGARLSLDDFETGYSSLSYLNRFPVKKVKIDQAFSRQAIESPKTQAIISAISALAKDLNLDLVAEGVETQAQLGFMASKNIFLIQGYLYSKPRPIEELAPLLECWSDAPRLESAA